MQEGFIKRIRGAWYDVGDFGYFKFTLARDGFTKKSL